jgi:hypothetical protein
VIQPSAGRGHANDTHAYMAAKSSAQAASASPAQRAARNPVTAIQPSQRGSAWSAASPMRPWALV